VAYAAIHLGADGMSRAVATCTINPARLLGLPDFAGGLALGARANIVLFSLELAADRITIDRVIRDGRHITERHDQ
jgi:imidazolonepropionase-like amidohydrolase